MLYTYLLPTFAPKYSANKELLTGVLRVEYHLRDYAYCVAERCREAPFAHLPPRGSALPDIDRCQQPGPK